MNAYLLNVYAQSIDLSLLALSLAPSEGLKRIPTRLAAMQAEERAAAKMAAERAVEKSGGGLFRKADADLLQSRLGPARVSHPEEYANQ
jgi:hypothetical protein